MLEKCPKIGVRSYQRDNQTDSPRNLLSRLSAVKAGSLFDYRSCAAACSSLQKKAEQFLDNGITLLLVFGIVLMLAVYSFMDPILRPAGALEATLPYAHSYLAWYMSGTLFVMITIGLNPFLTTESTKVREIVLTMCSLCSTIMALEY